MKERIATWRSADIPSPDRYAAWADVLQSSYGTWAVGPAPHSDMDAAVVRRSAATFDVVDCVCDPCSGTRGRAEINCDERESLSIQLIRSGTERVSIGDTACVLKSGDVLIWTSVKPTRFDVTERLHKTTVTIPIARVRSWLPHHWHRVERHLLAGTTQAVILSSLIGSVSSLVLEGGGIGGDALVESTTALLAGLFADETATTTTSLAGTQLALAKTYISDHLADPGLTPERIASARRISTRYLHRLFASESLTVQQYVIHERLARCRRDLHCPNMRHRTITDIAFSWGFQNGTHFGRRFREQFGMTPLAFRGSDSNLAAHVPHV